MGYKIQSTFQETGPPDNNIGKTGDYYVDTANKIMYGPNQVEMIGERV